MYPALHVFPKQSKLILAQSIHPSSPCSRNSVAPMAKNKAPARVIEPLIQGDHLSRFRDKYFDSSGRISSLRVLAINSGTEALYDLHSMLTLRAHVVVEADSTSVAQGMVQNAATAERFGSDRAGFQVIIIGREFGGEPSVAVVAERMRTAGFDGIILQMRDSPPDPAEFSTFKQHGGDAYLLHPFNFQGFSAAISGTNNSIHM